MFKSVINKNKTEKQKVGEFGENMAISYLKKNKYKIINKNIKVSYKEIDIIAFKNKKYIFVEVKTRIKNNLNKAEDALNHKKIINLKKALNYYVKKMGIDPELTQFDLIAIDLDKKLKIANIKHFECIF